MGMTEDDYIKMFTDKFTFVKRIEAALKIDPRSGVQQIDYYRPDIGRRFRNIPANREIVVIRYRNGNDTYIDVTGNSDGANMKEICSAVYFEGAKGEYH